MSRLWQSGFEYNVAAGEWDVRTGTNATVQGTTVNGGVVAGQVTSLVSGTAAGWLYQFVSAAANGPYYFRIYFYAGTLPSAENSIIELVNGTTLISPAGAMITVDNSGVFRLYRDQKAAQVGSASSAITTGTWHYIELKYDRSPAGGSQVLEAKLDGTVFATASNLTITNQITSLGIGGNLDGEAQTTGTFIFDDVAINNSTGSFQNSYADAGKIVHMHPTGAGDNTGFGIFAGTSNWSAVAEVSPDGNTSAVQAKVTNTTDDYAMTASSSIGASDTINVLAIGVYWEGTGASANSTFAPRLKAASGGTVTQGSTIAPTTTGFLLNAATVPKNYPLVSYQKPGTASAWTKADLSTAQIGLIIVAGSTNNARISSVVMSVDYAPPSGSSTAAVGMQPVMVFPNSPFITSDFPNLGALPIVVASTSYNKTIAAGLSFTGGENAHTNKSLSGILSFAGSIAKAISHGLAAALSFTGSITKKYISAGFSAAVSFTGSFIASHLRLLSLTGALSFIGSQTKSTVHNSTAAVSFTGSNTKQTARSQSASLSFSGNLNRATARALTATVSFIGSVTKAIAYPLTATVSFIGSVTKRTSKALAAATVSFSGSITRAITYPLSGALSFSGTLAKKTARAYTATVSVSGSIAKAVAHLLGSAALSFIGNLATSFSHGGTQFTQSLAAAVSFSGTVVKQTNKTLTASVSFTGSIVRATVALLSAAVSFTGAVTKLAGRSLGGVVNFNQSAASIAFVQTAHNGATISSGATVSATLGSSPTIGNTIIVTVGTNSTLNSVSSVTDDGGNTYTRVASVDAATSSDTEIWWATVSTSGANFKVKATCGVSSATFSVIAQEFSGLSSNPFDQKSTGSNAGSNSITSGNTPTTLAANELVVGAACAHFPGGSFTIGSGYSNLDQVAGNPGISAAAMESKIVSSTGAYAATFTQASNPEWGCCVATFTGGSTSSNVLIKLINLPIAASLSFTGNITRRIAHGIAASLSFVGNLIASLSGGGTQYTQTLTAAVSFVGSQIKQTARTQVANLSFSGSLGKKIARTLTAAVSFAGTLLNSAAHVINLIASLSFTGAQSKRTTKVQAATVSFTGAVTKSTGKAVSASLSFSASIARLIAHKISAALSFIGNLVASPSHGGTQFTQSLVAALSFTGSQVKRTARTQAASLNFSGANLKQSNKSLAGKLAPASGDRINLITNPSFEVGTSGWQGFVSTISQDNTIAYVGSGSLKIVGTTSAVAYFNLDLMAGQVYSLQMHVMGPTGKLVYFSSVGNGASPNFTLTGSWDLFTWTFTAAQGSGSSVEIHCDNGSVVLNIDAVLLETGNQAGSYFDGSTNGGIWTGTANTSTSYLAGLQKRVNKGVSAALSFSGLIARVISYPFTATISFTGSIGRRIPRSFTGNLTLSGSFSKSTSKLLAASLSFTTAMSRAIAKGLAAAVTFAGALVTSGKTAATLMVHVLLRSGNAVIKLWNRNQAVRLKAKNTTVELRNNSQHITLEDANEDIKTE